jgi:Arc/MetJ family transcription regulator
MKIEQHSISFDAEVVQEAKRYAGQRGLSRLVNAAVRRHLQSIRLRKAEEELTAK